MPRRARWKLSCFLPYFACCWSCSWGGSPFAEIDAYLAEQGLLPAVAGWPSGIMWHHFSIILDQTSKANVCSRTLWSCNCGTHLQPESSPEWSRWWLRHHKHPYHPGLGTPAAWHMVEVPFDGGIGQSAGWLKVPSRHLCASLVSRSSEAWYASHIFASCLTAIPLHRHTVCVSLMMRSSVAFPDPFALARSLQKTVLAGDSTCCLSAGLDPCLHNWMQLTIDIHMFHKLSMLLRVANGRLVVQPPLTSLAFALVSVLHMGHWVIVL